MICAWCRGPIEDGARRDAVTCSKRCRQARQRFTSAVGVASAGEHAASRGDRRRLAYADPPYPGLSRRYYGDHPDYAGEVDHAALIAQLQTYDGWALSTNASSLQGVLALCPPGVSVASWHRGERPNAGQRTVHNGWEPVIYTNLPSRAANDDTSRHTGTPRRVDTLEYFSRPRLADPHRVIGSKPAAFCRWVFDLLDAQRGDELDDLFPGSGGIGRAWDSYTRPV